MDHVYFTVHLEGITIPELSNEVEGERGEKEFINTSDEQYHGLSMNI